MNDSLPPSLFIIDDSSTNIRMMDHLLEDCNYLIQSARSGKEALELLNSFKPDVILLDIKMPEMNGFECCKQIRQHQNGKTVPVIFLSGSNGLDDELMAKEVGGSAFLTKPISRNILIKNIELYLP